MALKTSTRMRHINSNEDLDSNETDNQGLACPQLHSCARGSRSDALTVDSADPFPPRSTAWHHRTPYIKGAHATAINGVALAGRTLRARRREQAIDGHCRTRKKKLVGWLIIFSPALERIYCEVGDGMRMISHEVRGSPLRHIMPQSHGTGLAHTI